MRQHRIGQFNFMPREWWEEQCEKYLKMWHEAQQPGGD